MFMQGISVRMLTALPALPLNGTAPGPMFWPITSADTPLEMSKNRVPRMRELWILVVRLVIRFDLRSRGEGIVVRTQGFILLRGIH